MADALLAEDAPGAAHHIVGGHAARELEGRTVSHMCLSGDGEAVLSWLSLAVAMMRSRSAPKSAANSQMSSDVEAAFGSV